MAAHVVEDLDGGEPLAPAVFGMRDHVLVEPRGVLDAHDGIPAALVVRSHLPGPVVDPRAAGALDDVILAGSPSRALTARSEDPGGLPVRHGKPTGIFAPSCRAPGEGSCQYYVVE